MPRRRFIRRLIIGLLLSIVLIVAAGLYAAWRLSWQEPTWYRPPNPREDRVVTLADDAEYSMLQQSQKVRPATESWTLRLTQHQINAWLAARLPAWIEHDANLRWPEQIGTPQALIEPDGISIAAPVTAQGHTRTVVARLLPRIAADGRLGVTLTRLSLGRVWIPGEPLTRLTDSLRDAAPEFLDDPAIRRVADVLAGRSTLPATIDLNDGRRIVMTSVRLEEGVIEVAARTTDAPEDPATQPSHDPGSH